MDTLDLLGLIADTVPLVIGNGDAPDSPEAAIGSNPTAELPVHPTPSLFDLMPSVNIPARPGGISATPSLPTPAQYGRPRASGIGSSGMRVRVPSAPRASKPRSVTGNSGIDLSNLDLGELLFLVLHPQGPQVLSMMSQAQQQKRNEEMQRQQMVLEQAQMERANRAQDLNARLVLSQAGARPLQPGFGSDWLQKGGATVTAPGGEEFLLPSREERARMLQDQEEAKAVAAARVEAIKASAKAANEPKVPLAPEFIRLFNIPFAAALPLSVVDSMTRQYNARKPQNEQIRVIPNNDGQLTVVRAGPQGTTTETVPGGPVRPAATAGGATGLTPNQARIAQRQAYQDEVKHWDDAKKAHDAAQALRDQAASLDRTKNPPGDPNTDPDWQKADIAMQNAARAYPGLVEAGRDANGYPYVKMLKPRPTPSAPAATAPGNKAGGPGLSQSQQERDFALQKYKAMTPEQKQQKAANGQTYREWFIARYGLDPDTL